MTRFRPAVCERSRSFMSLRLDGELPELQQRMLDAHLAGCATCRRDAHDFAATTSAIRTAPLEPVEPIQHVRAPRHAAVGRGLRNVTAVAATVLVALGVGSVVRQAEGPGDRVGERVQRPWPVPSAYLSDQALLWEQQHILLRRPGGSTPPQLRF
jgi:predicted anti-sigma-YlaC factor YlaD